MLRPLSHIKATEEGAFLRKTAAYFCNSRGVLRRLSGRLYISRVYPYADTSAQDIHIDYERVLFQLL